MLPLVFADVVGYGAENNYRIKWKTAMSNEVPWYVQEVPTVFVSLNFTTHLTDVPMVKAILMHTKILKSQLNQLLTKSWVNQNSKEHQMKMFGVINGKQDL